VALDTSQIELQKTAKRVNNCDEIEGKTFDTSRTKSSSTGNYDLREWKSWKFYEVNFESVNGKRLDVFKEKRSNLVSANCF